MRKYTTKRIFNNILLEIGCKFPLLPGILRAKICNLGGVNFISTKRCFVGDGVLFDHQYPENITIGEHTIITSGVKILSHYYDTNNLDSNHHHMKVGKVVIGRDVFIGMNTVIANSVIIGDGAIIGANTVITKDVSAQTIVAGNPARIIRKRNN